MEYNREIAALNDLQARRSYRLLFKDSSAIAVRKIFEHRIGPDDGILEIGSGLGWLVKLVPEYSGRIQQTEGYRLLLERHLQLNPTSNIIFADFYDLPFGNNSFDIVVGLNTFDHLSELERAVLSMHRVLDKNGRIIHMRDLAMVPESLSKINYDRNKFVPFPAFDETYNYHLGIRLVPKNLDESIGMFGTEMKAALMNYLSRPEQIYESALLTNDRELLKVLAYLGQMLAPDSKILDFRDYFLNYLTNTFRANGLTILDSGVSQGEVNVRRGADHEGDPTDNIFLNQIGRYMPGIFEDEKGELKPGEVKVVSQIQYIVALKNS